MLTGSLVLAACQEDGPDDVGVADDPIRQEAISRSLADHPKCLAGDVKCVRLVVKAMKRRFQPLAEACDHNAVFALFYLRITERFQQTVATIGYADPASVIREDAIFADLYFGPFDAFHEDRGMPSAWQIAFEAAENRRVTGIGNLRLAVNAHIQRDLPFTLYEASLRGHPVSHDDHTKANEFLAQVDANAELGARFDPLFSTITPEQRAQQLQFVAAIREQAFRNYERLRDAPTPEARALVAADIEANAAAAATAIVTQMAYPPGTDSSARDAYCANSSADLSATHSVVE